MDRWMVIIPAAAEQAVCLLHCYPGGDDKP